MLDVLKRLLVGHIVDDDDAVSATIVWRRAASQAQKRPEASSQKIKKKLLCPSTGCCLHEHMHTHTHKNQKTCMWEEEMRTWCGTSPGPLYPTDSREQKKKKSGEKTHSRTHSNKPQIKYIPLAVLIWSHRLQSLLTSAWYQIPSRIWSKHFVH